MNYGKNEYQEETTTTLSLADQLQATINLLEEAGFITLIDQKTASAADIIKTRDLRQQTVDFICEEIVRNIKAGAIPCVTIQDEETREWLKNVSEGTGSFQSIWDKLITWARNQRLYIFLENSIVGGEDVMLVSAKPLKQRGDTTYRG